MQLETVMNKLVRYIKDRSDQLSLAVTSGGVDNMEKYNYIIGQITALEATRQELSNLLNDKEQNENTGTVVDIGTNNNNTKQ
jgi:hypothetical protein|tara:strand:+ start:352 stop:597 length:246 start_codon:yes stop_codon:yes gene_type:complete